MCNFLFGFISVFELGLGDLIFCEMNYTSALYLFLEPISRPQKDFADMNEQFTTNLQLATSLPRIFRPPDKIMSEIWIQTKYFFGHWGMAKRQRKVFHRYHRNKAALYR